MTTTETTQSAPEGSGTPRPEAMPSTRPERRQRGPVSRFFSSLFSHLLFSGVVVAGVLGYLYHAQILRDVGDTVCARQALGQWMSDQAATATASTGGATIAIQQRTPAASPAPANTPIAASPAPAASPVAARPAPVMTAAKTATSPPSSLDMRTPPNVPAALATAPPPLVSAAPEASTAPMAASAPSARDTADGKEPSPASAAAPAAAPPPVAPEPVPPEQTVALAPATPAAPSQQPSDGNAAAPPSHMKAAPDRSSAPSDTSASTGSTEHPPVATANVPGPPTSALAKADREDIKTTPDRASATVQPTQPNKEMVRAWIAARRAFAEGKGEAVTAYRDLAQRYPKVPQITGELGNILFQQRKLPEAAAQYYETAERLIRVGQLGPATCLIDAMTNLDIIRYLDAAKVTDLKARAPEPCPLPATRQN